MADRYEPRRAAYDEITGQGVWYVYDTQEKRALSQTYKTSGGAKKAADRFNKK